MALVQPLAFCSGVSAVMAAKRLDMVACTSTKSRVAFSTSRAMAWMNASLRPQPTGKGQH